MSTNLNKVTESYYGMIGLCQYHRYLCQHRIKQ